ncbi:MAG: hypoxanthine phosphoribosyltransferase [Anaerolineae bacterium]|nr:hypoxanthine phosphoribosyltransferase [Anaerolineae bacterium]MCO5205991.1 hypoxanthine phosphoribosyltransferase [Anaerolineae bacterium]
MSPDLGQTLFSAEQIQQRVNEMGAAISADYAGLNPVLVGVLKGVMPFLADLMRAITIPLEIDFMAITSYSSETRERGIVRIEKDLSVAIEGRHVIFVEDVIDTGLTLNYLLRALRTREPATLQVCTLFDKSVHRLIDIDVTYQGFDLPDRFVVGYGLDYREKYRNLPFVALLKPHIFGHA